MQDEREAVARKIMPFSEVKNGKKSNRQLYFFAKRINFFKSLEQQKASYRDACLLNRDDYRDSLFEQFLEQNPSLRPF